MITAADSARNMTPLLLFALASSFQTLVLATNEGTADARASRCPFCDDKVLLGQSGTGRRPAIQAVVTRAVTPENAPRDLQDRSCAWLLES